MDSGDSLSGGASGSAFSRIAGGVVAPLVIGLLGLHACVTRRATLPGRGGISLDVGGPAAVSFGIALLGVALLLHFHFAWTTSERLYRWADIGKTASLIASIAGLVYMIWCVLMD